MPLTALSRAERETPRRLCGARRSTYQRRVTTAQLRSLRPLLPVRALSGPPVESLAATRSRYHTPGTRLSPASSGTTLPVPGATGPRLREVLRGRTAPRQVLRLTLAVAKPLRAGSLRHYHSPTDGSTRYPDGTVLGGRVRGVPHTGLGFDEPSADPRVRRRSDRPSRSPASLRLAGARLRPSYRARMVMRSSSFPILTYYIMCTELS